MCLTKASVAFIELNCDSSRMPVTNNRQVMDLGCTSGSSVAATSAPARKTARKKFMANGFCSDVPRQLMPGPDRNILTWPAGGGGGVGGG
eukprot:347550-Chlamydomonas_euryale.AAC.2